MAPHLVSTLCTEAQLASPEFQRWPLIFKEDPAMRHRKLWEWCYIAQALEERGMLQPGKRGLGFAVGREPLAAVFAGRGCSILATDLSPDAEAAETWKNTAQHATTIHALNDRGICHMNVFERNVAFRYVDMNDIPDDLEGFDFLWSSCSFEHLGNLELGLKFVKRAMDCLKPGGIAIHTTEYNMDSNTDTVTEGVVSIYRRRDIEALARDLRLDGHGITLTFPQATGPYDWHVDTPPYTHNPHLRLWLNGYVVTSYGLIIQKPHTALKREAIKQSSRALYKARALAAEGGRALDQARTLASRIVEQA